VVVVDSDMRIRAWNSRADALWGVRPEEAVGEHLMNLDIGLPVEKLRQPLRLHLSDSEKDPSTVVLDAVNRRGRSLQVRVTVTHVQDDGESRPAAMLVMDVVAPVDGDGTRLPG
jgi:two-component system CheB/CheR fusion protein